MLAVGDRFRSRVPLQVICWWWYDPAAILDDYSDSSDAVLPPGEPFTVEEIPGDEPSRVLCHLDHATKGLQRHLFPHGLQDWKPVWEVEVRDFDGTTLSPDGRWIAFVRDGFLEIAPFSQ
jgi:hypothetical protein